MKKTNKKGKRKTGENKMFVCTHPFWYVDEDGVKVRVPKGKKVVAVPEGMEEYFQEEEG